jgi:hypothetical protein
LLKLSNIYPELGDRALNNKSQETIAFKFILKNYKPTDKEYLFFIPEIQVLKRVTILQELGRFISYLDKVGVDSTQAVNIVSKEVIYIVDNKINTTEAVKILQEVRGAKGKRGDKIEGAVKSVITTINNQRLNEEELPIFIKRIIEILKEHKKPDYL